ncbi:MAG: MarR family transcriptional regulator [Phycisphaerae bacterium]|nr:MarR family transcriptional regulator [Phycisphaerae bacterium]
MDSENSRSSSERGRSGGAGETPARGPADLPQCCLRAAQGQFVSLWGEMAEHWGINRTMSQVHALLMISPDPMTAEQIMEELQISRGNVSMNLRELIHWGIVRRTNMVGDRRDFFAAEADVWIMFHHIFNERKRRELDPLLSRLEACLNGCAGRQIDPEKRATYEKFIAQVGALHEFFAIFHRIFGRIGTEQPGRLAQMVKAFEQML